MPVAIDEHLHRFTAEDLRLIVESGALDDARVELRAGLLHDMTTSGETHVRILQMLQSRFTGDHRLIRNQAALAVADGWVLVPDLAIAARRDTPDGPRWPVTAEFVAEISVTSRNRDFRKATV